MSQVFKLSDACSIAFHAMTMLAAFPARMIHAREMARTFKVSEAHLAKVMQRLARAGLVKATRGPHGGFELARDSHDITLLQVYEAIEGPLHEQTCLLGEPACAGGNCILGGLLQTINHQVKSYLQNARLSELTATYDGVAISNHPRRGSR